MKSETDEMVYESETDGSGLTEETGNGMLVQDTTIR